MRRQKWEKLLALLKQYQRVLVAFSGGADSTLLLAAACSVLPKEDVLAVTAISASLPLKEKQATVKLAAELHVSYVPLATDELSNPSYASNPPNRCFYCKDELFRKLSPLAQERGMKIVDGFNVSDRSDYRPGFQASQAWSVAHPLDEAGLDKKDIRVLSRWLKLPTWNKPASPCLSSRIPYGSEVTAPRLRQIEKAEEIVRAQGFRIVRVRHYGEEARVEVPLKEVPRLLEAERWEKIQQELRACGYRTVTADLQGFQSGKLNIPTENALRPA